MDDPTERRGGLDRRGFLECMAWAGTGALYTLGGGVLGSVSLDQAVAAPAAGAFTFLQISDSHVGFNKAANPDARVTLREAVAKVKALPRKPDFVIHTGDVSQLSRDTEFDDADQILRELGLPIFYVPGEHDLLDDGNGKAYLARYGKGAKGAGWYSFDHAGVHFVALVNVVDLKAGGMGNLGDAQLAWLADDLKGRPSSQPVVVFAHIPLWTLYPEWGWGTADAGRALDMLKRFGSVSILNGHIHQIQQKTEGRMVFHTARSTAFPQPEPGKAPSPGPQTVPADQLRSMLGLTSVAVRHGAQPIALIDSTLA